MNPLKSPTLAGYLCTNSDSLQCVALFYSIQHKHGSTSL